MKTIEFPKFKDYVDQYVKYIQPKMDGHLAKITIDEYGCLHIYSKNDKDISDKVLSIDHINCEISKLPDNSIIFGELHCPDIHATSVPTMLNDADENLQLTAFAAPLLGGIDSTDRCLVSIMEQLSSLGLNVSFPTLVKHDFVNKVAQEILLERAAEKKLEGWVLKEGHMTGWYKLKPVRTVDAFVIATYESISDSHRGGLKCVRVAVWKGPETYDLGTVGNGFKKPYRLQFTTQEQIDAFREEAIRVANLKGKELTEAELAVFDLPRLDRNSLLNKVCEVAFDSVAAAGKLRFPRFLRWRDDKDKIDCTEDQLEN